jgi:hypothetical protein
MTLVASNARFQFSYFRDKTLSGEVSTEIIRVDVRKIKLCRTFVNSVYALPLMWETKFHTHSKQLVQI